MLGRAVMLAVSLLGWSSVPAQPVPATHIAVTVTSAATEQMARRLTSAVVKEVRRDPRFTLVERPTPGVLNISLPAGVGWERRLDWTEISYQARVNSSAGQSRVVAGRCYNWSLGVCAKQIIEAAAQMGGN
jgi:hypothetical protein